MMKTWGKRGSPCLIYLLGWIISILPSLTRIEIKEEEIQDMMRELSLGDMLKNKRTCLMKLHSILSMVFSRLILRIMLPFLPFIFPSERSPLRQ